MNSAAMEYASARSDFFRGTGFASPTHPTVPPGSIMRYPIGIVSMPIFLMDGADNACAPVIQYGFVEFSKLMNSSASAYLLTPLIFPGNSTTGKSTFSFNAFTVRFKSSWSVMEPPTSMPSLFALWASLAMVTASSGVCSSKENI